MRFLPILLIAVIVLLQNPLWFGKGGWLRVHALEEQVAAQKASNDKAQSRNVALEAEVRDLKQGYDAIEERARTELGMIRRDEVFFHVISSTPKLAAATGPTAETMHPSPAH